jgi:hypothetical protein
VSNKILKFCIVLSCLFMAVCSGGGDPGPGVPTGPNWSLYVKTPAEQVLWGSNISDPAFTSAWLTNGLLSESNNVFSGPITQIGQNNWASAMAYLQSSEFTSQLPTITSYTCYDRNLTRQIGGGLVPVNNNCNRPAGTGPFVCTVYSTNHCPTCAPQVSQNTATCIIGTQGVCTQGALPSNCAKIGPGCNTCTESNVFQGSCEIQNSTQVTGHASVNSGSVVDGCYLDGQGPNPSIKHTSGFYCLGWQQTTYDLTKVNLQLKNLYGSGEVMGCMSPGTVVSASTQWGGLGIGSTCTAEDPSITNIATVIPNPNYLDPIILYSNPYNDDQISGINPVSGFGPDSSSGYFIFGAWAGFCQKFPGFCQAPVVGTSTSGLAHLMGRAGPVALSEYVTSLKATNPTSYYTWQYDDAAGTIVCKDPGTQVLAYFCAGTQLSTTQAQSIFSSSTRQSSRFAVVNNCPYEIWVQINPSVSTSLCTEPFTVNDGSDCLVSVAANASYVYDTPSTGKQSFQIWSKTGCDATGFNCITGEIGSNNGHPRTYGSQPNLETKVEATFGCTLPKLQVSSCQTAPDGKPLISATFYDVTFVDGYTRPVSLQMIPGPLDTSNSDCKTPPPPNIDLTQCPTATDISTRP